MRVSDSVSKRLVYVYIRYVYTDSKKLLTEVIHHKNIRIEKLKLFFNIHCTAYLYVVCRETCVWFLKKQNLLVLMESFFGDRRLT